MPREIRENLRPLDEIEDLVVRVLGAALPERLVAWMGMSKRNAERWLSGESTYPPAVLEKLDHLAPLADRLTDDLRDLVDEYKAEGVPENLLRMQIREFSKTLTEEPPPKPEPRRDD